MTRISRRMFSAGAAGVVTTILGDGARAAGAPDDPLRVGLLLDMTSILSELGGAGLQAAVQMAVDDFGGKVLGRPIQVLVSDHQNKGDVASAKARQWLNNDNVSAILDVSATVPTLATIAVGKEANKLVITNGAGAASIVNEQCTPISIQYSWNTSGLARTVGKAVVEQGGDSWFFVTTDYTFGTQLEKEVTDIVTANGGKVLGSSRVPLGTADYASPLLQAQASKAKVVGFALAGQDLVNAVKQAAEFGLNESGQRLAGLIVLINDIHGIGLPTARGMLLAESFYWDMNDATRAFSKRFHDRLKKMPNGAQAGSYSSAMHYLQAVAAAGTDATGPVNAAMRRMPINDFYAQGGHIREDGLMVHDVHLFQVKQPGESKAPWDYYKLVSTVPGDQAFPPLSQSTCPLVKH